MRDLKVLTSISNDSPGEKRLFIDLDGDCSVEFFPNPDGSNTVVAGVYNKENEVIYKTQSLPLVDAIYELTKFKDPDQIQVEKTQQETNKLMDKKHKELYG